MAGAPDLERLAVRAAVSAARLIVDERPTELAVDTKSSRTDVVTDMDQRAQDHLLGLLASARPQDGILGEERGGRVGTSGITWVLDPIDGTVNYLYGIPSYAVSVAAVVGDPTVPGGWHPVAGAVVNASTGEVFHARKGGGARRDGMPLSVGSEDDLSLALIATGFGYAASDRARQAAALREVLPAVRDIRRFGSAALDLCAVASGRLDGYYEEGLNAWDFAAGWLIVAEAGGVVTGLTDLGPSSELLLAASPEVHPALLRLLRRAFAAGPSAGSDPPE